MEYRRRRFATCLTHRSRRHRLTGSGFRVAVALVALLGSFMPGLTGHVAAQDNVDGNVYVSPTFGYELEWDEDAWEFEEESSDERDFLTLRESDGTSLVYVEGYEGYGGDPDDCLEGSADEILNADPVSDVEPLEDEDGDEVAGESDGVVFAAYSFVFEAEDGPQDRAGYFTCQTLVEDEAVLAFSFMGLLDDVEDDLPVWEDLLAGVTLPDDAADDRGGDEDDSNTGGDDEDASGDDEDASGDDQDASGDDQDADSGDDRGSSSGGTDEATAAFGGGIAHTGEQPGPAPADEPEEAWAFETGDDFVGANAATVSVEDGLVFTSSNAVYAIDIETGEEVWTYESEANIGFVAPLALADGVLYAAGEDGHVYAFEPDSGDIIWDAEVTDGLPVNGGPLVDGDRLYVTSWDGNAYLLETATGDLLGSISLGGTSYGQPSFGDEFFVLSAPDGGVMARDADSGEEAWTFEMDGTVYSAPVIADGVVFARSDAGLLVALELESGDEIWSAELAGPNNASLSVADGVVYVADGDSVLYAFDAESGDEIWTTDVDGADLGGISVTETEDGDVVILLGDGDGVLHAFDEDGEELYAAEVTDAAIFWPATVVDGVIYVSARDGALYAMAEG